LNILKLHSVVIYCNLYFYRWTRNGEPLPVLDFNFKDMESIKVRSCIYNEWHTTL